MKYICLLLLLIFSACQDELGTITTDLDEELDLNYSRQVIVQKNRFDEMLDGIYWRANQSITIYGDYLFVFLERWKNNYPMACIFDKHNLKLISCVSLPKDSLLTNNHCNAAQFSTCFFEEGDEFPLLYLSSYNNGGLNVIRIHREENNFSFEIVQEIRTDNVSASKYGNSFCVDSENGKLYMYYNVNGNYLLVDDNDLFIEQFNLPDPHDKEVMITKEDRLDSMHIPFVVFQGSCFYKDRIYMGVQGRDNFLADGSYVLIIDFFSKEIEEIVRIRGGEPEGIAIDDQKLYVSLRRTKLLNSPEYVFAILEITAKETCIN